MPPHQDMASCICRVQSAYENHKDEVVWDGDRDAPVLGTEDNALCSQGAGVCVPTAAATFNSTGIQTESVLVTSPGGKTQATVSATPGTCCED